MTKLGDACTVRIPKASTYLFFCQVHSAQGMKGVLTVGSGGGPGRPPPPPLGPAATLPVTTPKAAAPPAGKPAIYRAGWGLFAVAALLALLLIALHVRFTPGFNRQKR